MKTQLRPRPLSVRLRITAALTFAVIFGSSLVPLLHAIPNQVGAIGAFINPAGMRLEDYANREVTWKPNTELKGTWEMWTDTAVDDSTVELLKLKEQATVYGITALEVVLQRRDSRALRFEVKFSTEGESSPGKTRDQLIANIIGWTGTSFELKDSVGSVNHEHITVKVDARRKGEVRLILAPNGKS